MIDIPYKTDIDIDDIDCPDVYECMLCGHEQNEDTVCENCGCLALESISINFID